MIKFVIVEDEDKMIKHVSELISKELFDKDIEYKILSYKKYDSSLKKEIKDLSTVKLYIMDIELENSKSGIEIAKEIREQDWESNIIFLTSHDHMFETAFRNIYNIFRFIEKFDNMDEKLTKDIRIITQHNFDNKTYKYTCRATELQIFLKTITYITRDTTERKLIIYTDTNSYEVTSTISKILKQLDKRFQQVSRSTIINKDKISKINWKEGYFILNNSREKHYLVSKTHKDGN